MREGEWCCLLALARHFIDEAPFATDADVPAPTYLSLTFAGGGSQSGSVFPSLLGQLLGSTGSTFASSTEGIIYRCISDFRFIYIAAASEDGAVSEEAGTERREAFTLDHSLALNLQWMD